MNLKDFEAIRADISHSLLRNGVFSRLGAVASVVESPSPVDVRAKRLVETSLNALGEQANIRKAAQTWLSGDGARLSVKQEILQLIKSARTISGICPDRHFPDETEIERHIAICDKKMEAVNNLFGYDTPAQKAWLEEFWNSALVVYDVVHSFGIHCSDNFWGIFRSESTF